MANNKDFILKNAVEVVGPTKVTLGSITSSDIDLATGNHFINTLSANTTYTISDAGDVQAFQLEVTGASSGFDLVDFTNTNKDKNIGAEESTPTGVTFKNDGTIMYICGTGSSKVFSYALSTAWDVSTAGATTGNFSFSSQRLNIQDIFMKPDGTSLFMAAKSTAAIFKYNMSTPWDLSTMSYANVSFDTTGQQNSLSSLTFNSDGTRMFIGGNNGDKVDSYTLATAWGINSGTHVGSSNLDGSIGDANGIQLNPDGTRLFITDDNGTDSITSFDLSTAWDLSTYNSKVEKFTVDTAVEGLSFSSDGLFVYIIGNAADRVRQYSTKVPFTITWPSSIEWAGGVAPAAPAHGETDVFTIATDDSGTSYVGVKTADNLS